MNGALINNAISFWQGVFAGPQFPPHTILLVPTLRRNVTLANNLRYLGICKLTLLKELQVWFVSLSKEERIHKKRAMLSLLNN